MHRVFNQQVWCISNNCGDQYANKIFSDSTVSEFIGQISVND